MPEHVSGTMGARRVRAPSGHVPGIVLGMATLSTQATCLTCDWKSPSALSADGHARSKGHRVEVVTRRLIDPVSRLDALISEMDRLGLPSEAGGKVARRVLRESGAGFSNALLAEAVRRRKS